MSTERRTYGERSRRSIPLDALIAGQLFVRQTFLSEPWLLADENYWTGIESAVNKTFSLKDACFQFKFAGKDPRQMAVFLLKSLNVYPGPDIPKDSYWGYVDRVAGGLFENYPDDYKSRHMERPDSVQ